MKRTIILCSAAILLSGCSIYKQYSRSESAADGLFGPGAAAAQARR